ncbi:MAG: response regulator [Alphaproteobacteria bacterium]|nr:response regulator [Alphaproteobacteria bacterium]
MPQPNILIIDDSETDSLIMREALSQVVMGNNITILNNATEAIDLLNLKGDYKEAERPDLIILDINMPDFDGFEFLRVIKKDPRFIHIPTIALSGSKDPKEVFKSYKLGANCFIHKPNDIKKFKQVVAIINEFWLGIAQLPKKD